jgi:hypothetical protein
MEERMDGACEGGAGATLSSVGAALARGESCKAFVLLILLTILIGPCRLSLSDCGLADGLGQTQRIDPVLKGARDQAFFGFESGGSRRRILWALSGSLGLARDHEVHSHLAMFDS